MLQVSKCIHSVFIYFKGRFKLAFLCAVMKSKEFKMPIWLNVF